MGLDMYLKGDIFSFSEERVLVDGFPRTNQILELGYWRKHPNLHGYIVNTFAGGVDECQTIGLDSDDLKQLIAAVENDELPSTSGFFFGESATKDNPNNGWKEYSVQKEEDLVILRRALTWLQASELPEWRSVEYRASW